MKIKVVDTLSVSLAEGILIKAALDMRASGKSVEETAAYSGSPWFLICAFSLQWMI